MLTGDFFIVKSIQCQDNLVEAVIEINRSHLIFEGHFPGQPVVPGVCMMQMMKELLEKALATKTRLTTASQVKFLAIINPVENNIIQAKLEYTTGEDGYIQITASLFSKEIIHFKMNARFSLLNEMH